MSKQSKKTLMHREVKIVLSILTCAGIIAAETVFPLAASSWIYAFDHSYKVTTELVKYPTSAAGSVTAEYLGGYMVSEPYTELAAAAYSSSSSSSMCAYAFTSGGLSCGITAATDPETAVHHASVLSKFCGGYGNTFEVY